MSLDFSALQKIPKSKNFLGGYSSESANNHFNIVPSKEIKGRISVPFEYPWNRKIFRKVAKEQVKKFKREDFIDLVMNKDLGTDPTASIYELITEKYFGFLRANNEGFDYMNNNILKINSLNKCLGTIEQKTTSVLNVNRLRIGGLNTKFNKCNYILLIYVNLSPERYDILANTASLIAHDEFFDTMVKVYDKIVREITIIPHDYKNDKNKSHHRNVSYYETKYQPLTEMYLNNQIKFKRK